MSAPAWYYARWLGPSGLRVFEPAIAADQHPVGVMLDTSFWGRGTPWFRALFYAPSHVLRAPIVVLRDSLVEDELSDDIVAEVAAELRVRGNEKPTILRLVEDQKGSSLPSLKLTFVYGNEDAVADLPSLRRLELQSQMDWTKSVLKLSRAHFELPSGGHSDVFIRVADTFADWPFVSRLADWIQPYVAADTAIVADTWTLGPLVQELRHRAAAKGWDLRITTFKAYPEAGEVVEILDRLRSAASGSSNPRLLFILSVASTRALLTNVRQFMARFTEDEDSINIVTLVGTSGRDGEPMIEEAFVQVPARRYNVQDNEVCALCREPGKGHVVRIDRHKYVPNLDGTSAPKFLKEQYASEHRVLWEAASTTDAVRVHYSQSEPLRHLEVFLDVGKMLDHRPFYRSTISALRKNVPLADFVIVPKHPSTDALVRLAKEAYPEAAIAEFPRDDDARIRLASQLSTFEHILIVDDAVINGGTMRAIHRFVQDSLTGRPPHRYEVHGFCVVGRPATRARWERLRASFRQAKGQMHLVAAHEVWIPQREGRCPWCHEARVLEDVLADAVVEGRSGEGVECLRQRADALAQSSLERALFICGHAGQLESQRPPEHISPNSLFGEGLNEAAAYAAVATAMQSIRVDEGAGTVAVSWNVPKILTAYHDPLLSASFLRAMAVEEVLPDEEGDAFRDALQEVSFGPHGAPVPQSALLAAELEWAVNTGSLPAKFRAIVRERAMPILSNCQSPIEDYVTTAESLLHGL